METNQVEKIKIYILGNPKIFLEESKSNTIGIFKQISSTIETITNFCWCLFFIFIAAKAQRR